MKKQLTINHIVLSSLRTRRKQYVSLTVSIVLAIYFVSAMMLIGQSMNHTLCKDYLRREGSQDAILCDAETIDPQELITLGYAKRVGSVSVLGETEITNVSSWHSFGVGELDEVAKDMGGRPLSSGRMPEDASEIAIEKWALRWIKPGAQLGDEVTISLSSLMGNNMFMQQSIQRSYTLVGILTDKNQDINYDSTDAYVHLPPLIVTDQPIEVGAKPAIHRLIELSDEASPDMLSTYAENKLTHYNRDHQLLTYAYSGPLQSGATTAAQIELLALVLVVASCLGIVNAFTALLTDRRSQIGMLRAVGATRQQIRRIFGREALIIALIATPFAMALSVLTVWGLCTVTGLFDFYMTIPVVVLTAILSLIVVMAAALVPLWHASNTSPMQAIRETSLLRAKKNLKIKQQSHFDVPTLLAQRHISLYRNKQVGICAIVAMSLLILSLLFIMADSIIGIQINAKSEPDYRVGVNYSVSDFWDEEVSMPRLNDSDRMRIAALPLISRVEADRIIPINMVVPDVTAYIFSPLSKVPDHFAYLLNPTDPRHPTGPNARFHASHTRERYRLLREQQPMSGDVLLSRILVVDEESVASLAAYVTDGSIDMGAINRGEDVIVYAPPEMAFYEYDKNGEIGVAPVHYQERGNYKILGTATNDMFFAGDTLTLNYLYPSGSRALAFDASLHDDFMTDVMRWDGTPRISAVVSRPPDCFTWLDQGDVITTFTGLSAMGIPNNGYRSLNVYLSQTPSDELAVALYDELDAIAQFVPANNVDDNVAEAMTSRNAGIQAAVCGAAMLILFFAICLSMVNNALTNRMRSEKRPIGTMSAVGASLDMIASSYFKQLLRMLGIGIALGIALGCIVVGLYTTVGHAHLTLPLFTLIAADLSFVFLVLLASMMNLRGRLKGIMRSSIVDNIREL